MLRKAIFPEGWGAGLGPHWGHASNADIPASAVLHPSDQPEKREEYDRADDANNDIADKAKAASAHNLSGNPPGNSADHQENY